MVAHLRHGLGLVGLLGLVSSDALCLDALRLGVLLLVASEEVDLIVVRLSSLRRGLRGNEGFAGLRGAGEGGVLRGVGLNVVVPSRAVGELGRVRRGAERLEDVNVRLRGGVAEARISKQDIQIRDPWRSES